MGDSYSDAAKAGDRQRAYIAFAREVIDYLKNPSEIPEQIPRPLEKSAQELDLHKGWTASSVTKNLLEILSRLQQGNWDTWRKLYLNVNISTANSLKKTMKNYCSSEPRGFFDHSPVKDLMGYPREE